MNKYKFVFGLLFVLLFTPLVSSALSPIYDEDVDSDSTCVSLSYNMRHRSKDSNTNGEVSDLQDFLQAEGYLNTEPTGYFGLLTKKAVQSFQKANNINGDGYVNSFTRAKIKSISCGTIIIEPITNFPSGCSSYLYYSSTTGLKCDGSTTASYELKIQNPSTLLDARVGEKYSVQLTATGGDGSYVWGMNPASASFPVTGLSFRASGGPYISGVPAELYENGVRVSKLTFNLGFYATSGSQKVYKQFTLTVVDPKFLTSFPPGCSSRLYYSSTTGLACDGSGGASDIITSFSAVPSTIDVGQSSKISWTSKNATFCGLGYPGNPSGLFKVNDVMDVAPQKTTTYSLYCYDNYGRSQDQNITVNVNPVTDSTPKISYLTNAYVPIGGDSSHARVNDKIYVFGSNFNSNSDVIIDSFDGSQYTRRPTTFINSKQLSFIVPSHIKIGSHSISIQVNTTDQPSLLSNAVSLSVGASFYPGCSSFSSYDFSTVDGLSCNRG